MVTIPYNKAVLDGEATYWWNVSKLCIVERIILIQILPSELALMLQAVSVVPMEIVVLPRIHTLTSVKMIHGNFTFEDGVLSDCYSALYYDLRVLGPAQWYGSYKRQDLDVSFLHLIPLNTSYLPAIEKSNAKSDDNDLTMLLYFILE